jgi:hypothetical protein
LSVNPLFFLDITPQFCYFVIIRKTKEPTMNIEYFDLPEFWLSALINSDESGLSDEDSKALNEWLDGHLKTYTTMHALTTTEDVGFLTYHDARSVGVLACDCVRVAFDVGEDKAIKLASAKRACDGGWASFL